MSDRTLEQELDSLEDMVWDGFALMNGYESYPAIAQRLREVAQSLDESAIELKNMEAAGWPDDDESGLESA